MTNKRLSTLQKARSSFLSARHSKVRPSGGSVPQLGTGHLSTQLQATASVMAAAATMAAAAAAAEEEAALETQERRAIIAKMKELTKSKAYLIGW